MSIPVTLFILVCITRSSLWELNLGQSFTYPERTYFEVWRPQNISTDIR